MTRTVVTPETLMAVKLTDEWSAVDCFHEEWTYNQDREPWIMTIGGHGRMFGNKHAIILLNRCGEYYPQWRLYVDGEFVQCFKDIVLVMGSGKEAEEYTEEFMRSIV